MKLQIRNRRCPALVITGWLVLGAILTTLLSAYADSVILPRGAENTDGSTALAWPSGEPSTRFQEVINSEELAPHMPNGAWITRISFRRDGSPGTAAFDRVEVLMSTTGRRADGLSTGFSENFGPDASLVFSSETVSWVFRAGVSSFDAVVPLMAPYLYLPSQGSLLIDMRLFGATLGTGIDAHHTPGDGISMVANTSGNLPFGTPRTAAPVIKIDFTPIPEPSVIFLLSLAWLVVCVRHMWKGPRLRS